jgi:YD repeat-containing protein
MLPSPIALLLALLMSLCLASPAAAFHFPWDQGHDTVAAKEPTDPGPDDRPPCDPESKCGATSSPVYAARGHAYWQHTDLMLHGRPGMGVRRTYNSNDPVVGLFGNGWSVDFDIALYPATGASGEQQRILKAPNGKRYTYTAQEDGSFKSPASRYDRLSASASASGLTLTQPNGQRSTFAPDGRILAQIDPNNNAVAYNYDAQGRLTAMADGQGRTLAMLYNAQGLIGSVIDHTGRSWRYDYDQSANLVAVSDPLQGQTRYSWQAFKPAGDAQTYYQLLSATDPSGAPQVNYTYTGNQATPPPASPTARKAT